MSDAKAIPTEARALELRKRLDTAYVLIAANELGSGKRAQQRIESALHAIKEAMLLAYPDALAASTPEGWQPIEDYWHKHYVSDSNHCSLCGNHGFIDSSRVLTPAGFPAGRVNYCVCPNGVTMRAKGWPLPAPPATEAT